MTDALATVAIVGCGDIGRRIAQQLTPVQNRILAVVATITSHDAAAALGCQAWQADLDAPLAVRDWSNIDQLYYLVPPPKTGNDDTRSQHFLTFLEAAGFTTRQRIVLISTTGVYGDCDGQSVTEQTALKPMTSRAVRRVDSERRWQAFADQYNHCLSILRVPGIYSYSRLPRARLLRGDPVVEPAQCGYTNRIHADDLAHICVAIMRQQKHSDVYNVSDGAPGRLSDYLLQAANVLRLPAPPVISMEQAKSQLSEGMLSYLRESRRIDNRKLLQTFAVKLRYPDFLEGMKHG